MFVFRPRRVGMVALGLGLLAHASVLGQADRQVFRTTTDLVRLDVVVLDDHRRPVTGLSAADFEVSVHGQPQAIQPFASVTLPPREPAAASASGLLASIPQDVVGNVRPRDGRLVVILMDRTIPMESGTVRARAIARAVVDALGPGDLAAIVRDTGFANEGRQLDFTGDKARLRGAIETPFIGLVNPPTMTSRGLVRGEPSLLHTGDCMCGQCALESLEQVARSMGQEVGRQKLIVFIGSNIIIQAPAVGDCEGILKRARERAFQALDQANVTVHSIDPRGLETLAGGAEEAPHDARRSRAANLVRQGNLAVFPDYTGGRTVVNTNEPEAAVAGIFDESQSYYLIGIPRTRGGDPGERREVRVRIRNHHDFTVRARTGYYAQVPDAPAPPGDPLDAAIAGLLPKTDIPLHLALTPRFLSDGRVALRPFLAFDASSPAAALDVIVGVFDEKARPVTRQRQAVQLHGTAVGGAIPLSPISLAPGHYAVRVGVRVHDNGATASVYGDVEIPDAGNAPFALSGITLGTAPPAPADAPSGSAPRALEPTLRRAFATGDRVVAFAQMYDRQGGALPEVRAVVRDASGQAVSDAAVRLKAATPGAPGIADVQADIPTGDLRAGRYVFSIEAASGDMRQRQDVAFEIHPGQ
jgi:VWFA-related protein